MVQHADIDHTGLTGVGGGGSGQGLVDFASARRTSGNVTLNSTSWANVDTGIDLVLTATSGDWVEVGLSAYTANGAVDTFLDAATIVSASPVNYVGASGGASDFGVAGWVSVGSVFGMPGGSVLYQLQAGDISGGTVTLRLRYRTGSAANRTLSATAATPLHFWAKNLGASL